jgi:DNA-3-methyladenine glycosylase
MSLPLSYYQKPDVVTLSRDLLGKYLFTQIGGVLTGGIITETEAYAGPEDKASHAYGNRRTKRTEVMFHEGGKAYIYLCYGMHTLFNVVTNVEGIPHAILIRAIQPTEGLETILQRRGKVRLSPTLTNGPGTVCQALGISLEHNGSLLTGETLWIEKRAFKKRNHTIVASPRIGVDYAQEHAALPWRFQLKQLA